MKNWFIGFNILVKGISMNVILVCILTSCAFVSHKDNSEAMYIKASALTKLSAAVEATVRYENPPANLSDRDLLILSTQDDPTLLEPFTGDVLKVSRDFNHAIVLVCSSESNQALLEDAGCTAKLDNHLWQQNLLCQFTLKAETMCNQ